MAPFTRVLSISTGVLLLAGSSFAIRVSGITLWTAALAVGGVLLLLPALHVSPRSIDQAIRRVRLAAVICFAGAFAALGAVASLRGSRAADEAVSLSAALWLVAMTLTFVTAFYASKRRALARDEK